MSRRSLLLLGAATTPTLDLNFVDGSPFDGRITFTRASGATYFDATGTLQTAASNVPRIDYGPLAVTTNAIRNSTMQGVVPGTPGTWPTNWGTSTSFGLTVQIVGAGTESGLPYVDVRWSGTTSSAGQLAIFFEASNGAAALSGQPWTLSSYLRITAGSLANITAPVLFFDEYSSTSTFLASGSGAVSFGATDLASGRQSYTRTLVNASTAFVRPSVRMSVASGVAVDITLRIGAPQLEQAAVATPWVPTSGTVNSAIAAPGGVTNWIRNSSAAGAVAGTPGTLPTLWANFANSLSQQIVSSGTINGMPYIDLRLFGTSTNTYSVFSFDFVATLAAPGQAWTTSAYLQLIAGSLSGVTVNLEQRWNPASGGGPISDVACAINGTMARFSATSVAPANQVSVYPAILFNFSNATAYDFTIRIGAPQLELGVTPTAWIPTTTAAANVGAAPLGLLVEEQRTNSIRNPRAEGAVAGTPGTTPTNWSMTTGTGLTASVVGTGTEGGIPYADLRFSGTTTAAANVNFILETATAVAALTGQVWTLSAYARIVSGSLANINNAFFFLQELTSAGVVLVTNTSAPIGLTSNPLTSQRKLYTATTSGGATVANVRPILALGASSGVAVDFTLRIGTPQLELGAFATSPILPAVGTPAASTRAAETVSVPATSASFQVGSIAAEALLEAQPTGNAVLFQLEDAIQNGSNRVVGYITQNTLAPNVTAIMNNVAFGAGLAAVPVSSVVKVGCSYSAASGAINAMAAGISPISLTYPPPVTTPAVLGIGVKAIGAGQLNGWVRRARVWPRALSTSELQTVTT